jgi:plastocyanin
MKYAAFVVSSWLAIAVTWMAVSAAPDTTVNAQLFKFRPDQLEITPGTRVMFTNQDEIAHTVTSGTPEKPDRAFDIRLDGKGASGSFAFTRPGVFSYFCARHPAMRGAVHVN